MEGFMIMDPPLEGTIAGISPVYSWDMTPIIGQTLVVRCARNGNPATSGGFPK